MLTEEHKAAVLGVMERGFNQGDLSAIDEYVASDGIDYQHLSESNFCTHLKDVITNLRTAFPDLHFEIHQMLGEGDIVAFRSTMTGTHLGVFQNGAPGGLPPSGRKISVPHMHFVRIVNGKGHELWHLWDIPEMMRQLGVAPAQAARTA